MIEKEKREKKARTVSGDRKHNSPNDRPTPPCTFLSLKGGHCLPQPFSLLRVIKGENPAVNEQAVITSSDSRQFIWLPSPGLSKFFLVDRLNLYGPCRVFGCWSDEILPRLIQHL